MIFDFSKEGEVQINMKEYIEDMIDKCKVRIKKTDKEPTPMATKGFIEDDSRKLNDEYRKNFHMIVAKGLYACKRGRPDIHTAITHLTRQVRELNVTDMKKLIWLLKYINGTKNNILRLSPDYLKVVKCYMDASFAVHPDFKSHTGGVMTYRRGTPIMVSRKQ